jgi:hypothetical protein
LQSDGREAAEARVSKNDRWRLARFPCEEQRAEFLVRAAEIGVDGIEVEPLENDLRVRFRAPARYEVGIATMIGAHGGTLLPTFDPVVFPHAQSF